MQGPLPFNNATEDIMKRQSKLLATLAIVSLVGGMTLAATGNVLADEYKVVHYQGKHGYQGHHGYKGKHKHKGYKAHRGYRGPKVIHHGAHVVVPKHRVRRYHDVYVYRPHGHWYPGYGHYYADNDAFAWLAFTAITLKVLDNLNEQQQREHEAAQVVATTAPIGETIVWQEGNARGAVTATREGTTTSGRYCREFQHEVMVGNRKERAYGVACRQPDGAWEIVSTGSP
jgi:hypothetical protein